MHSFQWMNVILYIQISCSSENHPITKCGPTAHLFFHVLSVGSNLPIKDYFCHNKNSIYIIYSFKEFK